jgi:NADH-quinone oxidoreductase subunit J
VQTAVFAAALLGAVAAALVAVLNSNLLHAAVALGLGSTLLAVAFFLLDAPYAGGFELSVGAGLISVLFVIAITLTERAEGGDREP